MLYNSIILNENQIKEINKLKNEFDKCFQNIMKLTKIENEVSNFKTNIDIIDRIDDLQTLFSTRLLELIDLMRFAIINPNDERQQPEVLEDCFNAHTEYKTQKIEDIIHQVQHPHTKNKLRNFLYASQL